MAQSLKHANREISAFLDNVDQTTQNLDQDQATRSKQDEIISELQTIKSKQQLDILAGPNEVTIDTVSKTLDTLGVTLNSNLKRITLIPESSGIYWASGTATAGVNPFPKGGGNIECTSTSMASREFVVSSGTIKMQVIQEG